MESLLDYDRIPEHIAIIMDGNGRWAKKKGFPRVIGHKAGMGALKEVVRTCSDIGVKILTIYAFSTENWKRPKDEVGFLMSLLVEYMKKELMELHQNNVRIKILGDMDILPSDTKVEIERALELTADNNGLQFNIALNYGGRVEIVNACKNIYRDIKSGKIKESEVDESVFQKYLYTGDDPDPDLIIRTSGEKRISNFLLWQLAYSEFVFVDRLWPDFNRESLIEAIAEYQNRNRRFGAI